MSLEHILDIAFAFRKSKALLSAVELRLFDVLAEGPQSAHDLTGRLGLHGRGARDFLDALVALKLLDRDEEERYSNAPACSTYLDPRQPTYIGGLLEYLNARMYRTWDCLTPAPFAGQSPMRSGRGQRIPELLCGWRHIGAISKRNDRRQPSRSSVTR